MPSHEISPPHRPPPTNNPARSGGSGGGMYTGAGAGAGGAVSAYGCAAATPDVMHDAMTINRIAGFIDQTPGQTARRPVVHARDQHFRGGSRRGARATQRPPAHVRIPTPRRPHTTRPVSARL